MPIPSKPSSGKAAHDAPSARVLGTTKPPRTSQDFHEAAREGVLSIAYQPQVDLETGDLVGLEALARWIGPDQEAVQTGDFVAELEASGAVVELDHWMMAHVELPSAENAARVSVNLSPYTLLEPNFSERVGTLGVRLERLEVELTEQSNLQDLEASARALELLRRMGCRVALDDFGVGFSSLERFRALPVDTLKIDRAFVAALPEAERDASVICALVTLARRERLGLVAEGIEIELQAKRLRDLGVTAGQGFLFARPMAGPELAAWYQSRPVRR